LTHEHSPLSCEIATGNYEQANSVSPFTRHFAMLEFQDQIHQISLGPAVVGVKTKPLTGRKLGITHKHRANQAVTMQ
jgi:hypothetical protein